MNAPDWLVTEFMQTSIHASCDEMDVGKLCGLYDQLVLQDGNATMPKGANAVFWRTFQFLYDKVHLMKKGNNSTLSLTDKQKSELENFKNYHMAQLFEYAVCCEKGISKNDMF